MEPEAEKIIIDRFELDRRAWNLPLPVERPQTAQAPSSVPSGREDEREPEPEAA